MLKILFILVMGMVIYGYGYKCYDPFRDPWVGWVAHWSNCNITPGSYDYNKNCTWVCNGDKCICKKNSGEFCPSYMTKDKTGHCVPNPDLSKDQCVKKGGSYVNCSSFSSLSNRNNAIACLLGNSGCYSPTWVESKRNTIAKKVKNILTPKNVITTALMAAPISKVFKIPSVAQRIWDSLEKSGGNINKIRENKPLINMKYDPNTGSYKPQVMYTPRPKPLKPEELLSPPKTQEDAKNIIDTSPNLKDFEKSPFNDIPPTTEAELRNEMLAHDLDTPQVRTKMAEDLREIFKRSEPKNDSNLPAIIQKPDQNTLTTPKNFPMVIPDPSAPGGQIQAQVKRTVKHLGGNLYDVMYVIKPQGASKPTVVHYQVTLTPDHAQVVPKYKINNNNYVTTSSGDLYSSKTPFDKPVVPNPLPATANAPAAAAQVINNYYTTTNNYNSEEENKSLPDVASAQEPIQKELKKALDYKIILFTCPEVTPKCPNDLNITMFGGHLSIPSPVCAAINAMQKKQISPKIDLAGNFIVMIATILGLLTLFKRD